MEPCYTREENMLINISNHPSSNWSSEQLKAATEKFGGVKDIPFPNVDPSYSTEEVEYNAIAFYTNNRLDGYRNFLVAGEPTFVMALVICIQNDDSTAWVGTSDRISKEVEGKKISEFVFNQFREYPRIYKSYDD